MKILVAEDDSVSRVILKVKLRNMGYDVIVTEDGGEAWEAFHAQKPHLVITDWMMPNVDGLELCRRIRSQTQERYIYIVILTGVEGKKAYLEGIEAGADDFLHKPVDMDELTARLHVASRMITLRTEMRQLEGLLPICSYCKKIRDEHDLWMPIEGYISTRTEAKFSHGACPSCIEKYVNPELEEMKRKRLAR